jgi:hypothetical protein
VLLQQLEAVRFAPPWTQELAQKWWERHLAELASRDEDDVGTEHQLL